MADLNNLHFLESSKDKDSRIWLVGIPYDGTTSFKPGARFGPDEIRRSSDGIESYSPYQEADLSDIHFFDAGNLHISFSSPEAVHREIQEFTATQIKDKKILGFLGGEHSITYPIIEAYRKLYPGLKFIHIDAHADMREEFGGSKYSHASVIRRVTEIIPRDNYIGFGIRSGLKDSFKIMKSFRHFYPFNLDKMKEIKNIVSMEDPVYLSLDLDVIDPAFFPGTGAPEPAGVSPKELLKGLLNLKGLKIIGFDIVELSPPCDPSGISATVAAFITREVLLITGTGLQ